MFQCDLCCTMLELVFTGAPLIFCFFSMSASVNWILLLNPAFAHHVIIWPSAFDLIVVSQIDLNQLVLTEFSVFTAHHKTGAGNRKKDLSFNPPQILPVCYSHVFFFRERAS